MGMKMIYNLSQKNIKRCFSIINYRFPNLAPALTDVRSSFSQERGVEGDSETLFFISKLNLQKDGF